MSEQPSATSYSICYTKSANVGTCGMSTEPVTVCDTITPSIISYTLVNGSSVKDSAVADFEKVSTPGVYKGGFDLTNLSRPKIDLSKVTTLPDGRYTLFVTIDGKSAKVMAFKTGTEDDSAIKPVASAVKSHFAVRNDMRSSLTIVSSASAKYAVMDLQGRVVRQGVTAGAETVVPNLKPGSYIVKVARETRRVNVR